MRVSLSALMVIYVDFLFTLMPVKSLRLPKQIVSTGIVGQTINQLSGTGHAAVTLRRCLTSGSLVTGCSFTCLFMQWRKVSLAAQTWFVISQLWTPKNIRNFASIEIKLTVVHK